jgi:transposase
MCVPIAAVTIPRKLEPGDGHKAQRVLFSGAEGIGIILATAIIVSKTSDVSLWQKVKIEFAALSS